MVQTDKIDSELLIATEVFARDILENKLDGRFSYHTIDHTRQVVEASEEIGKYIGLGDDVVRLLKISSWLHDLGYMHQYIGHEEKSIEIARSFLEEKGMENSAIKKVVELIEATKLNQEPRNKLEEVIKDADLYNLATPEALENSQKIREEWKIFCGRNFSKGAWNKFNHSFFESHQYYTDFGKEFLAPRKEEHIQTLKKAIKKRKNKRKKNTSDEVLLKVEVKRKDSQLKKLKEKLEASKTQKPDRGVETMFRTTYRTHMNLSSIADNKANILLSINAIIISFVFTEVLKVAWEERGLPDDIPTYLLVSSFLLLVVCMSTIVFAILATRPKVNSGIFDREDILAKKTNLLFFGNFYRMDLDEYKWGINQMMKDAEYLYGSLATDIYFLGKVLAKKFQMLRLAYNAFMYGIGLTVLILVLGLLLGGQGTPDS